MIPHAFKENPREAAVSILAGIFAFFVLEKLLLWRHCHTENCEVHDQHQQPHDHGRSGALIIVGDTVHNFVDGVLIAAAFLQSIELGVVTAVAIIAMIESAATSHATRFDRDATEAVETRPAW